MLKTNVAFASAVVGLLSLLSSAHHLDAQQENTTTQGETSFHPPARPADSCWG